MLSLFLPLTVFLQSFSSFAAFECPPCHGCRGVDHDPVGRAGAESVCHQSKVHPGATTSFTIVKLTNESSRGSGFDIVSYLLGCSISCAWHIFIVKTHLLKDAATELL